MKNKFLLLGLGAAGLYYISSQKKTEPSKPKAEPEKKEEPQVEPPAEEEEDWKEEGGLVPLPEPLPEEKGEGKMVGDLKGDILVDFDFNDLYSDHLQTGKEYPEKADSKDLWISDSCQSWAIGEEFDYKLPQKLAFPETDNPEAMVDPREYWDLFGGDMSPEPWYFNKLTSDSIARAWTANLIEYHSGDCNVTVPRRQDYDTYQDYAFVIAQFVKTPIGELWAAMYRRIEDGMYDHWAPQYPDQAEEHVYALNAVEAVKKNKTKSTKDQTNIAYWAALPDGPKKIDPNNPEHKPYQTAWLKIHMYVKKYKDYVKTHGY